MRKELCSTAAVLRLNPRIDFPTDDENIQVRSKFAWDRKSTVGFYQDQEVRTEIYDVIQGILNKYDLLVTPTLACLPVDNAKDGNTIGPSEINGVSIDPMLGWALTYFLNFSGHPAASIPAGLSIDNLPVGMQIIGKRYGDADVLTQARSWSVCVLGSRITPSVHEGTWNCSAPTVRSSSTYSERALLAIADLTGVGKLFPVSSNFDSRINISKASVTRSVIQLDFDSKGLSMS
jgi:Amidase